MRKKIYRFVCLLLIPFALGIDPLWAAGVHGALTLNAVQVVPYSRVTLLSDQALQPTEVVGFTPRVQPSSVGVGSRTAIAVHRTLGRRIIRRVVSLALILSLSYPSDALAKRKPKTPPVPPPVSQVEAVVEQRINARLISPEEAEKAWNADSPASRPIRSFNDLLIAIFSNPKITAKFKDNRAEWSTLLSLNQGQYFGINSSDTHPAQEVLAQAQPATGNPKKEPTHPQIRDALAIGGVTNARPTKRVNTMDGPAPRPVTGSFMHRLAIHTINLIGEIATKIAGGIQIVDANTVRENVLENYGAANNVNQRYTDLQKVVWSTYEEAEKATFSHWIQERRVQELEAIYRLAQYQATHEPESALLEGRGPETLRKLQSDLVKIQGELNAARLQLDSSSIALSQSAASLPSDITGSAADLLSIPVPAWTVDQLSREIPDLEIRLERLLRNEKFSGNSEVAAHEEDTAFNSTNAAGFPTLPALFALSPDELGKSPEQRQLELQASLVETIGIKINELKKKWHFKIGTKDEIDTAFYALIALDFSIRWPTRSTKQGFDRAIESAELRIAALHDDITAEQKHVREKYLLARARRLDALQNAQSTLNQMAEGRRVKALAKRDRTLDETQAALDAEAMNQKVARQLAEAAQAWKEMQFLTVNGQEKIDRALEDHYVKAVIQLGAPESFTPEEINPRFEPPATPKNQAQGGSSLLKKIFPIIAAAFSIPFLGHFSSASAHTFAEAGVQAAVQGPVADVVQKITVDVVIGNYTGGTQNTLGGVATDILKASHDSKTSVETVVRHIMDLNSTVTDPNQIQPGILHIGSYDPSVAAHLPGFHHVVQTVTQAASKNAVNPVDIPTKIFNGAHAGASALPQNLHPLAPHTFLGLDPTAWFWIGIIFAVSITALFLYKAFIQNRSSGGWKTVFVGLAAFLGLASFTSLPNRAVNAAEKKVVAAENQTVAAAEKGAASLADNIRKIQLDNYYVRVIPDEHPLDLGIDPENPGVISFVRPGFSGIGENQPLAAPEPFPFDTLREEINRQWNDLHPNNSNTLIDVSLLGVSPQDLASSPIHIRPFTTGDSVGAQVGKTLFSIRRLVSGYASAKDIADKVRAESPGSTAVSFSEKKFLFLIQGEVRYLQALKRRIELDVTQTQRRLVALEGSVIQKNTPVNIPGHPVSLFKVAGDRTLLELGPPPDEVLAIYSAPQSGELRFVDQYGRLYTKPVKDILQIMAPGSAGSRLGTAPRPRTPGERTDVTTGDLKTVPVQMELSGSFPNDVVLVFRGVYASPEATTPYRIQTPLPAQATLVSAQLVNLPQPTVLRHAATAEALRAEWNVVEETIARIQNFKKEMDAHAWPTVSARSLVLQELDGRQIELEERAQGLTSKLAALDVGVDLGVGPNHLVVPADPTAYHDSAALVSTFPGTLESEQAIVLSVGQKVTIRLKGGVRWGKELPPGPRTVRFPSIDKEFTAQPVPFLENVDPAIAAPARAWNVTVTLARQSKRDNLSLIELQRLFHGSPNDGAVVYGYLTPPLPESLSNISTNERKSSSQIVRLARSVIEYFPSAVVFIISLISGLFILRRARRDKSGQAPMISGLVSLQATPLALSLAGGLASAVAIHFWVNRSQAKRDAAPIYIPTDSHRSEKLPPSPSRAFVLDLLDNLPGKLKSGKIVGPSRVTVLNQWPRKLPIRKIARWLHDKSMVRGAQTAYGLLTIAGSVYFVAFVWFPKVGATLLLSIPGLPIVKDLWPLLEGSEKVGAVIIIALGIYIPYVSLFQRGPENIVVSLSRYLHDGMALLDYVISIPTWGVKSLLQHRRHIERNQEIAAKLNGEQHTDFLDLARLGEFYGFRLGERLADYEVNNASWARATLKAFETYNTRNPDRRHPGSGALELISPEEVRLRLSQQGIGVDSLTPEQLETRRALWTVEHNLTSNALAIRMLLALITSRLVDDLQPSREEDDILWRKAGFALSALVNKPGLFPQVFKHYHQAKRSPLAAAA